MSRDLQQPPDLDLGVPQSPSALNDVEGGRDQIAGHSLRGGEIVGERELGGNEAGDAFRDEFFRLLNKRGLAARHE